MLPSIPGDWIVQGGAVGLLAFVALLVFLGWLVPRSTYRELQRDRDYWRAAALKAIGHTEALIPAAQITTEFTKTLSDISTGVGTVERAVERALGGSPAPKDPRTP